VVDIDGLTGTPRQVAKLNGFLTGPSSAPARDVAMGYVRSHLDTFGLSTSDLRTFQLRRTYVDIAGIRHLSWIQTADGIPVFGNGLQANVAKNGRLINVLGSPIASLQAPARSAGKVPTGTGAIKAARHDLGESSTAPGAA